MSVILDGVLAQAANGSPATVTLSSESVAVLLFGSQLMQDLRNWIDKEENQLDEITPSDAHEIERITSNAYFEIMSPIIGYCFPLITALPANCLLLDGSTYARTDYPALYDVLDTAFVLDADTFFLPDLRSRVVVGAGAGASLSTYTTGETGGEEAVTLSESQMPSHYHTTNETSALAVAPGELPVNIPVALPLGTTNSAGGGGSHENRMPFLALPWAVVAL